MGHSTLPARGFLQDYQTKYPNKSWFNGLQRHILQPTVFLVQSSNITSDICLSSKVFSISIMSRFNVLLATSALICLLPLTSGQVHGVLTNNPDGTSGANFKLPLAGGDKNAISAIGGLNLDRNQQVFGKTAGVALDNV